jgi:hypothetical protein
VLVFPCRRVLGGWTRADTKGEIGFYPTHWREWREAGPSSHLDALNDGHASRYPSFAPIVPDVANPDRIRFRAGTAIATSQHGPCHLVESGIVSLRLGGPHGIETGLVGRGGIVGIWNLLANEPLPISVVATTDCGAVPIPYGDVARRFVSDSKGLQFLHAEVARRWTEAMVIGRCNAQHSIRERVSRWILTAASHLDGPIGPITPSGLLGCSEYADPR